MSRLRQFWRDLDDPGFVLVAVVRFYVWMWNKAEAPE